MSETRRLKVTVNPDKCAGSTMCMQFCPEVFVLGENHKATVKDPNGDTLEAVKEAALGCPTMAINITDADTGASLFP